MKPFRVNREINTVHTAVIFARDEVEAINLMRTIPLDQIPSEEMELDNSIWATECFPIDKLEGAPIIIPNQDFYKIYRESNNG